MKNSYSLFTLIIFICVGCYSSKDFIAEYDYNYHASFKRYKTFAFVVPSEADTSMISPVLSATIGARLGSQGFREQEEKPDLLVSYKVFMDSIKYRGYVQPEFNYWLKRVNNVPVKEDGEIDKEQEKDETYNHVRYHQKQGMLVIYVIDSKRGNTIWQGYTAANFDYDSPNFQSDITRAAYRVMNEFKVLNRQME
ncbi:DUF4136 domain-containing protein [Algoriphagus chordae]|uniref:Uncharacterized protein DUF4136 n=1 Tax=Algoriphagus chordae TaxID=237019 RepID=A0A2W7SIU7_9BACT|nr:DUF4136 domain-containing protein [Algoriphagus chordae]PZX50612.1 uncharacterized protein DUF4136 [Algoriphagus chordae]